MTIDPDDIEIELLEGTSAVRVTHLPSGVRAESLDKATQLENHAAALAELERKLDSPEAVNPHCCGRMRLAVEETCEQHPDRFDCPDALVTYSEKLDEYGLIVHDGGSAYVVIAYCPWCAAELPESKRDEWFDRLEEMGLDPWVDEIPAEYESSAWWRSPN
jgi:hypothetical protein